MNLDMPLDIKTSGKENKPRATMRGKAALLLDTSSSDSDTETSHSQQSNGIYASIIKTTKQELKTTKNKFAVAESICFSL